MSSVNDSSPQWQESRNRALALAAEMEFARTPPGKALAKVLIGGRRETLFVESGAFRKFFQHRFFERYSAVLQKRELDDVLALLTARAENGDHVELVNYRTAQVDGRSYFDLGDSTGEVIEIGPTGWLTVPNPGVTFMRPPGLLPIAKPVSRKDAAQRFQDLFELTLEQVILMTTWLVMVLTSHGPFPILCVAGELCFQLAAFLRNLVDPHVVVIHGVPKNERDLMVAVARSGVVAIQVEGIPKWFNEWLGHNITGAGFTTRKNYSDDEAVTFDGMHPVILVGTDEAPSGLPGEHCLTIALPQVNPRQRRLQSVTSTELAEIESGFLAYVLDAAVAARSLDDYTPDILPHMADFFALGCRAEVLLWPNDAFAHAYATARLIDEPALIAILRFGLLYRRWTGSATELWGIITAQTTVAGDSNWPADPVALGKLLHEKGSRLEELGLRVKFWRAPGKNRDRTIILEAMEEGDHLGSGPDAL